MADEMNYPTNEDIEHERAFWFSDTLTKAHGFKRPTVLLVRALYTKAATAEALLKNIDTEIGDVLLPILPGVNEPLRKVYNIRAVLGSGS